MRIVVKLGTGILTTENSFLDEGQITRLVGEFAALVRAEHEVIIVSSGAVGAGLATFGLRERPSDLASVQACAAVGQPQLMHRYETAFAAHELHVAQLLLTHGDLDSRTRHRNARNTIDQLLATREIVPIINENDSVATEELARFRDNDRLSAEVAMLVEADLLVLLTSVDGVLDDHGQRVPEVLDIASVGRFVMAEHGRLSVGGMASKLDAVRQAVDAGITTYIASGTVPGRLQEIADGQPVGTCFPADLVNYEQNS